jgi:hypothetical protein
MQALGPSPSSSSASSYSSPTCPLTFDPIYLISELPSTPPTAPASSEETFTKCIKPSPDGSFLLSSTEDRRVQVHDIDASVINRHRYYNPDRLSLGQHQEQPISKDKEGGATQVLQARKEIRPGDTIYDFAWYPYAYNSDPSSLCFITTCRDKPVQLFGVLDGSLRGTYCVMNVVSN